MKQSTAIKRLGAAKRTIRWCKRNGVDEVPEQHDLRERTLQEREAIKQIARENDYAEPWASYIAPYQYDLQQSLQ